MMVLTVAMGATALALAKVAEAYVKRYHAEVWEELNRWED